MAVSLTGKYPTQSSTYQSAEHGVDGIYGSSGSMASTDAEIQPWWMVNLEKTCFVYEVKLFNRPMCKCRPTTVVISVECCSLQKHYVIPFLLTVHILVTSHINFQYRGHNV